MKMPRPSRRVLQIAGLLVIGGVLALGLLAWWEWTYLVRIWTHPARPVTDVAWYQPREPVPGAAGGELPTATQPAIAASALAEAAAYAQEKNSSALVVLHKGAIVAEHYWRGHSAQAQTNSMSMVKTVVALLIGNAIAEGKLSSVHALAANYLTEWADDERARISIQNLLQMCSGIGNADGHDDPFSDLGTLYLGSDSLYIVANAPVTFSPAVRFEYNSINTQALAIVLERATQRRYAEYLSEKLWQPIGAGDASVWLDAEGGSAKAFCCLFATARDWARVGLLIQNEGRVGRRQVVPAEWIRDMLSPAPQEADYGYHIWLGRNGIRAGDHHEKFLADDVVYLDGRHKQRVYIVPSKQLVIVRVGENAKDWDEAMLVNTILRGLAP